MKVYTSVMSTPGSGTGYKALAAAGVVAVGAAIGVHAYRKLRGGAQPPEESQWRRVGAMTDLRVYPLKSGQSVRAETLLASEAGVRDGALRDRVFVAIDRNGNFLSARTHPRLLFVEVKAVPKDGGDSLDNAVFEFRCPAVPTCLKVDPATLAEAPRKKIRVHKKAVTAVDCGDAAAAWIRKAVVEVDKHGEATPVADLRLVFYPMERSDREPAAAPGVRGLYSDDTSYHLLTTSSLAVLNGKLEQSVSSANFRPNFVVDGPAPFEEDGWTWVRIGDKAVFQVVMPCGRCFLTTVDPETGIPSPDTEPLKTLRSFRKPNAEQKKQMGGDSPMLGVRLSIHSVGNVSVGDDVYVYP